MLQKIFTLLLLLFSLSNWSQNLKFETFETSSGLSNNSITDIENDANGGLWIATWDGLNYYDGDNFTVFKHKKNDETSLPGNDIIQLAKDKNNSIWLLTKDYKVSQYLGNNTFQHFNFTNPVIRIYNNNTKNIVVQTTKSLYVYKNGGFKKTYNTQTHTNNNYNAFKQTLLKKYPDVIVNDIIKDDNGNIWFATRNNGLFILPNTPENINNTKIDHYVSDIYSNYSFKSNEINTLHKDVFGNIWLGHKDGGLSMAYSNSENIKTIASHPKKFPHLPNETIRAITKDDNGNIWLGYYTKGLYFFSKKTNCYLEFEIKEALTNSNWLRVRSLFTASDGSLWVGTYAGIIKIKQNKYTLYSASNTPELPNNRNYNFFESNKQLWIACWGGLAKFNLNKNKFEHFKNEDTLLKFNIRNIIVKNNNITIATENNGVLIFDIKKGDLKKITTKNGILGNSIFSIYFDENTNNYWFASLGGVSVYNLENGLVKNITEFDGLPSHMVYSLVNNLNKVWVSTTKGIAAINKNTFKVHATNPKEGWQAAEFSEGAYYQDPKGIIYFGGIRGLNFFHPNDIKFKHPIAKLNILINKTPVVNDTIVKAHYNNNLSANVKTILFPSNTKTSIYYKLNNFDTNWHLLKGNTISYNNLPFGFYELLIKNGNLQVPETKAFVLKINKPFYNTFTFYALVTFFVLACVGYISFIRHRSIKHHNKKLEQQIALRTHEIEQQKEHLLIANNKLDEKNKEISIQKEKLLKLHNNLKSEAFEIEKFKTFALSEFREPVSEIIKQTQNITSQLEIKETILKQGSKLINLISEWNYLDHVKDLGKPKRTSVNIQPIIEKFIEKQKLILQQNTINFNCEITSKIPWVEIDILRFKLLLQYIFHDIIKYSDSETQLNTIIKYKNNALTIITESNSETLKSNWYNIKHYSPYFRASKTLIKDLNATITHTTEHIFKNHIFIPVTEVDTNAQVIQTVSWKHLSSTSKTILNGNNILVYCHQNNFDIANQLLLNKAYNLIFENEVTNAVAVTKNSIINAIILYQASINSKLVSFLNTLKQDLASQNIPIIYISEAIDYNLQEQSIELGIDTVIQLPATRNYISKKITAYIEQKSTKSNQKLQQQIFKILTDKNDLETPNEKLIKKSLQLIKNNIQDTNFNVEKLITLLEISRVKCYRVFKEVLNQSPSDIIIKLRLEKACYLLKNKNLNISEVSFECGYNDPKYFSRLFKKTYSISPKAYKAQNTKPAVNARL
ncbi:helix-turn-helix domain-containing protein [Seonamhaeicola algicola]|uniref:Helix-turn-helix domain-containing protein n=1 Tax=Seonamhaeicola algicola TaxID=1719036 RepID=A0A5C7AFI9_9FLAO|nr:two-component regulator propeller domain-containing protein [Seonamhaeicola algicola]TXE07191.1 helix-turn-helix domain-containing protein [Seonamhaeicola algicola]